MNRLATSRLAFLAGSASFLHACSTASMTRGSVLPLASGTNRRNILGVADPTTSNIALSTNLANTAIAAHDAEGNFLGSVAFGKYFVRSTAADGTRTVYDLRHKFVHGWNSRSDGSSFAIRKHSAGKYSIVEMAAGSKTITSEISLNATDLLKYSDSHSAVSSQISDPRDLNAVNAYLAKAISAPGSWTGDDDFAGNEPGAYPVDSGFGPKPADSVDPCTEYSVGGDGDGDGDCSDLLGGDYDGGLVGVGMTIANQQEDCQLDSIELFFLGLAVIGAAATTVAACVIPEPLEPFACYGAYLLFASAAGLFGVAFFRFEEKCFTTVST